MTALFKQTLIISSTALISVCASQETRTTTIDPETTVIDSELTATDLEPHNIADDITINPNADHGGIKTLLLAALEGSGEVTVREWMEWERILLESGYDVVNRDRVDAILNEHALAQSGLSDNAVFLKGAELVGADGVLFVGIYVMPQRNRLPKFSELKPEQQGNPYIQQFYRNRHSLERLEQMNEVVDQGPWLLKMVSVKTGLLLFVAEEHVPSRLEGPKSQPVFFRNPQWSQEILTYYNSEVKAMEP